MENLNSKKSICIIGLVIVALLSIFVFSKVASSPEFHAKTIEKLDEKKIMVMELTAATATTSTLIAALPSDATSPLANQIIELSEYLLIIIGVIFLEKVLLTLTGYVTFSFLIPISCVLLGIYLYIKKDILKVLAIKLLLFGLIIFTVVPISVKVSDLVENTYDTTITQTIEETKNLGNEIEDNTESEEGFWSGLVTKAKDVISDIGDNISLWIQKGEKLLSNFIDAVAVLLITSCVIPIVVLIFLVWIIKIIFGINIPIKIPKLKRSEREDAKE